MATTARTKDGALGKEYKRGTSPSNSQTSQRVSSRQHSDHKEKPSEKNIPNYLKPTLSSRINEPLKLGNKKNIASHDQDNQKLLRRRSFDKPPSASPRAQKSLLSFDRAAPAPRERKMPVLSSSLGTHTDTVTTTKTPRVLKALKAVKSLPAVGSKPTKSLIVNKKESCNINASASKKSSSCSCDHEANKQEDLVMEVEEEVISRVLESETSDDVEKILNSCDISTEDQNLIQESRIDDDEVKADRDTQQEKEKINKEETGGDSSVPEDSEDHENVNGSSEADDNNIKVEEEKENREEAAASEGINQVKEEEATKVVSEGKKESPSAAYYNDVIEETASKLLEKRKNKVRALVGAFETVIDYESAASSK